MAHRDSEVSRDRLRSAKPVFRRRTAVDPILSVARDEQVKWIDRLQAAKVQAVRRNSPDLQQQLFQSMQRPIDTIVCTILDVDPNACLNSTLAARYPRRSTPPSC